MCPKRRRRKRRRRVFLENKILSLETILSAYTRTHTHRRRNPHTQAFWPYKAKKYIYIKNTQLKNGQQMPGRPEWMKTSERNRKHGRSNNFGKRNVFRLDFNESREGFCFIICVWMMCASALSFCFAKWFMLHTRHPLLLLLCYYIWL